MKLNLTLWLPGSGREPGDAAARGPTRGGRAAIGARGKAEGAQPRRGPDPRASARASRTPARRPPPRRGHRRQVREDTWKGAAARTIMGTRVTPLPGSLRAPAARGGMCLGRVCFPSGRW